MLKTISYRIIIFIFLFLILLLSGCAKQDNKNTLTKEQEEIFFSKEIQQVKKSLQNSIIEEHIPNQNNFTNFLKRDLNKYFTEEYNKEISTEFELFYDEPAQWGIGYPKYYAWVVVYNDNRKIEQGAVLLASIYKESFEVVKFMNISQIKEDITTLDNIFPVAVIDKIKKKL